MPLDEITISFEPESNSGSFQPREAGDFGAWQRLVQSALTIDPDCAPEGATITLPWYQVLALFREFAPLQRSLNFRFIASDSARARLTSFVEDLKITQSGRDAARQISQEEALETLISRGFTKRVLTDFQLRDVAALASISNGANFSVPGAGKTTVALALHVLTSSEEEKMLVVCPKAAFPAWNEIIEKCIDPRNRSYYGTGAFMNISGFDERMIARMFATNEKYFVTNYEHFTSQRRAFSYQLATCPTHLVLDESHRMKAGLQSQRGAALLTVANLPKRRDILTGTPMPQSAADLQSQLDFLWPGTPLGLRIQRGEKPRDVISGLYVRTTKNQLGLPPMKRRHQKVEMAKAQQALYGIVTHEVLRQLSSLREGAAFDAVKAKRSVMRLLQLASNPTLGVRSASDEFQLLESGVIQAVLDEGM